MRPERLTQFLRGAIQKKRRCLIKGKPGTGKSDIVASVAKELDADVVLMHPAIAYPTDFKGMPALTHGGTEAHFLPFGDLSRLCHAEKTTIAFLDDIGQAAPAVQAALMQLVLARAVNGTKLSEHVVFVGATNDTTHMAGVSGMIEPLKSRWDTIVELDVNYEDWCAWALQNEMPAELISFIRFKTELLSAFKPTREITNSPSPRTWASVGRWFNDGVRDIEVFAGAVGEGAATEFTAFVQLCNELPSLDAILMNPSTTAIPDKPAALLSVACSLAFRAETSNLDRIVTYLDRLPDEYNILCMKDAIAINPNIHNCRAFVAWGTKHNKVML